jgi:hypothetical protein
VSRQFFDRRLRRIEEPYRLFGLQRPRGPSVMQMLTFRAE